MSDQPSLSLRIDLPGGGRFGPGKAALLDAIDSSGTIREAAASLGMSYPRALKLIEEMNLQFKSPLVDSTHGGSSGGGSEVTPLGRRIMAIYSNISQETSAATRSSLSELSSLIAKD